MSKRLFIILMVVVNLGLSSAAANAQARPDAPAGLTITVNSSLSDVPDANPGDQLCETAAGNGVCTLRAAIMEANAYAGMDVIHLPTGTFTLTRVGYDDTGINGDLDILDDLILIGVSYNDTFIDGNGGVTQGRVFHVHSGVTAQLSNLRIRGGNAPYNTAEDTGGGILNQGTLRLLDVSVRNNQAYKHAGVTNEGNMELQRSFVTDNDPGAEGAGGIGNFGELELVESRISSNLLGEWGGIYSNGTLTITRSTISSNAGDAKGGIYLLGQGWIQDSTISNNNGGGVLVINTDLVMINSTISGNFTQLSGGGLYVSNDLGHHVSLHSVTIAQNTADTGGSGSFSGGGIRISQGQVEIANSLLVNNVVENGAVDTPDDCSGVLNSLGYNLIESASGCTINGVLTGNKIGQDPILNSLNAYGGPTLTHALMPGSPAIDSGNPAGCGDPFGGRLAFDQRSHLRHFDGGIGVARCDIGAFEYLAPGAFSLFLAVIEG